MVDFTVTFDVRGLSGLGNAIMSAVLEGVEQAVSTTAQQTQATWQAAVMGVPDAWLEHKKQAAESIEWKMLSPVKAEVFSDSKLIDQFEDGFPARDMKEMLNTSDRTRVSKNGVKYLIIPFRHNTPGSSAHAPAMPAHVYAAASKLPASTITGTGKRLSATGASVPQHAYKWGGKLASGMASKKAGHSSDVYAGMVKFDTSSGGQKSSAYLTFRVMTSNQTGKWLVAAKPGKHIARDVSKAMNEIFAMNMQHALQNVVTS